MRWGGLYGRMVNILHNKPNVEKINEHLRIKYMFLCDEQEGEEVNTQKKAQKYADKRMTKYFYG